MAMTVDLRHRYAVFKINKMQSLAQQVGLAIARKC